MSSGPPREGCNLAPAPRPLDPEDRTEPDETLSVLSNPEALADIREGDLAYQRGDVVRGVDAVRALLE